MSQISNKALKLMAKIYLGNVLNNISLDNDTSEARNFNKITDDETFQAFTDEFNKQSERLIKQLEKEIGVDMPTMPNLNEVFEFGFIMEERNKSKQQ